MNIYMGTISAVRDPTDKLNINKVQYEYDVMIFKVGGAAIPVRHVIRGDLFGSMDDFEDTVLWPGNRVLVWFPDEILNNGIIICAIRNTSKKTSVTEGVHRRVRMNKTEQIVDAEGHLTLKLDQGEKVKIDKKLITIDNSTGESIVINKETKSITVKAGKDWKTTLGGSMQVDATENVVINAKNATVTIKENATVKAGKKCAIQCEEADIKATKKATVESAEVKITGKSKIDLNEAMSPITTEMSHMGVVDLITGVPVQGVKKIKAG